MKVLFDQNMPRPLAKYLPDHEVFRSAEMGWSQLRNGELLQTAEEQGFEALVTADRNLAYQQNLSSRKLALVVLPSGQWPQVKLRLEEIVAAVDQASSGSFSQLPPESDRRVRRAAIRTDNA